MSTPRTFKALLLLATSLLAASLLPFHPDARAQSGRTPPTLDPRLAPTPTPTPAPVDYTHYDKVRVVVSRGVGDFVDDLNEQGRLGYRLEKTVSYGDLGASRKYAAVLHLDPGHTYEYASEPWQHNESYGQPFNYQARRGFNLVHTYPVIWCPEPKYGEEAYDQSNPENWPGMKELLVAKSKVFLFMRRDGAKAQTREYKVFTGFYWPGGNAKEDLQAALNEAPAGFRPASVFFWKQDWGLFRATVVAERDLNEPAPKRVEYRVVNEVRGFDEKVNTLAAEGSRLVGGGRISGLKLAVLARQAGDATAYTFIDDQKHHKEFARVAAAGNSYVGLLEGDLTCDSTSQTESQKLVFARDADGAPAREYRVMEISDRKPDKRTGLVSNATVEELRRLAAEGFRVRDIFYAFRLYAILERQAGARPASPDGRALTRGR